MNDIFSGRFNLVDCLHDFASAVTIHGDDVLAHTNWEIGETWLRRYGFVGSFLCFFVCSDRSLPGHTRFLVDPNTLGTSNKWRRERGLPELRMVDIAPEQQQTST